MLKIKTILTVSSVLALSSCSSVSGMFTKKEIKPPLQGERISVLELQKNLTADAPLKNGQQFVLPPSWDNNAWPQAGGYPNHSMQNLSLTGKDLKKSWSTDIGKGSTKNLPLTAQPVISNGVIYTLDTNANLSAFNADTGKRIWHKDIRNKDEDEQVISGGISIAHNILFITTGFDEILALSPKDGKTLWKKRLPAPSRAAPTVLGGRVYVSTLDNRLVTLNAKDGTNIWEYRGISETTGLLGAGSPAANNQIVVPTFSSGEITALRVENGSVAWSDNLSNVRQYGGGLESLSDIKAMPVIDQGRVIAMSFSGKLVAIDENTGIRIWQRNIGGSQTPWVAGNHIYVLSSENQLISLSLIDGTIFWIKQLAEFKDAKKKKTPVKWSAPIMASGRLYLAGSHGKIAEINPHTGEIIHTIKTKKNIQIQPIVANDTLYLLAEDGTLLAYR